MVKCQRRRRKDLSGFTHQFIVKLFHSSVITLLLQSLEVQLNSVYDYKVLKALQSDHVRKSFSEPPGNFHHLFLHEFVRLMEKIDVSIISAAHINPLNVCACLFAANNFFSFWFVHKYRGKRWKWWMRWGWECHEKVKRQTRC